VIDHEMDLDEETLSTDENTEDDVVVEEVFEDDA
jgi:hypothetical protein